MFISQAYAQDAAGGAAGGGLAGLLPLVLIFVVFYFLMIRPQQKRMKEHRNMLAAIRRGDKIVTSGGLVGTVAKVINDDELSMEIGEDSKIKVRVRRAMIAENLSGAAANDKAPAKESPAKEAKDQGKEPAKAADEGEEKSK